VKPLKTMTWYTPKLCIQAVLRLPCGWGKCLVPFWGANLDFSLTVQVKLD
jgi:hypothetical protein